MNQAIRFPVGNPAGWFAPGAYPIPNPYLKNWLLDTGSLTERLQAHCRQFSLSLLGQRQADVDLEEFRALDVQEPSSSAPPWQVREVLLYGDGQPWVYARSILPEALCRGDFAGLGEQPLGKLLFNDQRFVRMPFQLCRVAVDAPILSRLQQQSNHTLWGRRSVFTFAQYRIMVAELFLPQAPAYAQLSEG
ncbi:chorismate lyase [Aestuariibacter halophilus]|uniref:Probable chorismate pyruvate-lyase n=1 Tax=Fluctibacter halophilus TaxID=226011 RepID=A0ABS8GBS5_9ALTE|nr:chorismate lyase [Aestuariibacter halophilus]MCC2617526.1 chorismate lyase [Aestuariibacter halophilus]